MTASKSFGWSNTRRKSSYFLANGNLTPAESTACWLTSQRTVMFSAGIPVGGPDGAAFPFPFAPRRPPPSTLSPFMFARARPPHAIIAMFSLLCTFWARRKVGAHVSTPAVASVRPSIWRRVIGRPCVLLAIFFFIVCSFGEREHRQIGPSTPTAQDIRARPASPAQKSVNGHSAPIHGALSLVELPPLPRRNRLPHRAEPGVPGGVHRDHPPEIAWHEIRGDRGGRLHRFAPVRGTPPRRPPGHRHRCLHPLLPGARQGAQPGRAQGTAELSLPPARPPHRRRRCRPGGRRRDLPPRRYARPG